MLFYENNVSNLNTRIIEFLRKIVTNKYTPKKDKNILYLAEKEVTETSEISFTVEMTLSRSWVWLTLNSTLCIPSVGQLGALEGCMGLEVQTPRKKLQENGVLVNFHSQMLIYYTHIYISLTDTTKTVPQNEGFNQTYKIKFIFRIIFQKTLKYHENLEKD